MQMLYDSDKYVVVHIDANASSPNPYAAARNCFEIIDKERSKELFLDGMWADTFHRQIAAWQLATPTQEQVEELLGGYAALAQLPLTTH